MACTYNITLTSWVLKWQTHNRQRAGKWAWKLGEGSDMTTTVPGNGIISRWKEITRRVEPCFLIILSNDLDLGIKKIIPKVVDWTKLTGRAALRLVQYTHTYIILRSGKWFSGPNTCQLDDRLTLRVVFLFSLKLPPHPHPVYVRFLRHVT